MYQWFRTSFKANHTLIFLRAISDSNSLACYSEDTGALSFAGNTPKGWGEGLELSVNGRAISVSGKGNRIVVR